jgi:hypothetical protein
MTYSSSYQPDLDWSQIRETVKLLAVSAAQVNGSIKDGDDSVNHLADSFTRMIDGMSAIHALLAEMPESAQRTDAVAYCESIQEIIGSSVMAFQFYDRLSQCLGHTVDGLNALSNLVETPHRLYNPLEWRKLQEQIRSRYTMESEKIMFDAIHDGRTVEEALALAAASGVQGNEEDEVELF